MIASLAAATGKPKKFVGHDSYTGNYRDKGLFDEKIIYTQPRNFYIENKVSVMDIFMRNISYFHHIELGVKFKLFELKLNYKEVYHLQTELILLN